MDDENENDLELTLKPSGLVLIILGMLGILCNILFIENTEDNTLGINLLVHFLILSLGLSLVLIKIKIK